MEFRIALLPGDGIGPEVVNETVRVLEVLCTLYDHHFSYSTHLIGGCAIDEYGLPLTDDILGVCKQADAVLLGAVGGPKWDNPAATVRPEQGLLNLRKGLEVYANLRPVRMHPALVSASPLKAERLQGVDLIVVRELTGGLYFGQPRGREKKDDIERAVDTLEYYDYEIRRVMKVAFQLAESRRGCVTSVDKANVLESSRLWRQIADEVSKGYPQVTLTHMLVDTAAMRLVTNPANFDVIVTENMFGDILTDEASVLAGSMGMLPSASIGNGPPGLYEPIHGSAPDIAGKGIANPLGAILSAALMLRYSLKLDEEAAAIEAAVDRTVSAGKLTVDLGGSLTTRQVSDEVIANLN